MRDSRDSHKQMKQLVRLGAVAALVLAGCAAELGAEPGEGPGSEPATSTTASAVTIHDVDIAPECEGILGYANWASYQELDSYLPSNVADAIIAHRASAPFASIADLLAVNGVAHARLQDITRRARTLDFIDEDCAGVYEELAVSYFDGAAILGFVNSASEDHLWDVARTHPDTVAPRIVSSRPITSLQQLVDLTDIGPSTFRSIRDAAVEDPFDELVGRVNGAGAETTIKTAFNWYAIAHQLPGQPTGRTCFGVPYEIIQNGGGVMRPYLADAAEVYAEVAGTVSWANRHGGVGSSTAGLAHLQQQLQGHEFLGCYLSFQPNPWCGYNRAFFVNKDTGHRVFTETYWCE